MYVNCTPCLAFCIQCPEVVAVVIWRGAALSVPGAQHDSRRRLDRRPQSQEEGTYHLVKNPQPLQTTSWSEICFSQLIIIYQMIRRYIRIS